MTKTQENNLCRDIGRIARSLERIASALKGMEENCDNEYCINNGGDIDCGRKTDRCPIGRSQVARDIATIIENEKDMRVILQNSIVHCCDCKHWNFQDICGAISNEKAVLRTGFDFYCGYGERKVKNDGQTDFTASCD